MATKCIQIIHLQSISPGAVDTEMLASISQRVSNNEKKNINKILETEDVANAVIYSLSTPPNVLVSISMPL